ncbi:carbamoyltransferase [Streptomyces sp. 8K308]|uniref:carbamoyltransferase family protein n=1 Tax=Streptomyces sp. 8K308 TaxID=2530388 RepID=UPI00104A4FB8|nr:carbamoyltransferase C-terminal domain-containing protein [Streptomyces sp. 8K308]TDC22341.1 carbamoyltransferase [Streptomyces sp. 8K308]
MRVLGFSGMHDSVAFKRREMPDLDSRHYRIVQGLDAAAALVDDRGVVAAAAEERFTGEKATGAFPLEAISFCLERGGITMSEVDRVAFGFDYRPTEVHEVSDHTRRRFREVYSADVRIALLDAHWPGLDWGEIFVPVPHHHAHAASSYYLSGFEEALVLVADGMGETESMTVFRAAGDDLSVLRQVPALHSLGTLYGVVTLYLGFDFAMDEYKVMGLAPYGDRTRYARELERLVRLGERGRYTVPLLGENRGWLENETQAGALRVLTELFGAPRSPGAPVEQRHMDVAAAAQAVLERTLLHVVRHFTEETGLRKLCLAGGVALNCAANGLLARSGLVERMFVQPASGDDGTALGAALYARAQNGLAHRSRMGMPYWGPAFSNEQIFKAVESTPGCTARGASPVEVVNETARHISEGRVVAWFQGAMEFGPRALGNRSILADPRDPGMRDHLNAVVKQREDFRPFAPVVRHEDVHRLFDVVAGTEEQYAHMLFVAQVKDEFREKLPAVTHVDGTARVQVVRREDNERLWELIRVFGELSGVPVLLNTSFNLRGQPVIRDPDTALRTFLRSELDYLVMGDYLVARDAH